MITGNREHSSLLEMKASEEKAREFTGFLRETEIVRRYERDLTALKAQPEIYAKFNTFRRKNMELQILEQPDTYEEKTEKLQEEYKNILMESVVMDFLTAEQGVCKMMQKIYDIIAREIPLDISYMDSGEKE